MDKKTFELQSKQGAATSADLLQQEPHVEVTDPKPSAASAGKERLAEGITTIRLQTKRLSGAQRRESLLEKGR
jgi:hypothetical protein